MSEKIDIAPPPYIEKCTIFVNKEDVEKYSKKTKEELLLPEIDMKIKRALKKSTSLNKPIVSIRKVKIIFMIVYGAVINYGVVLEKTFVVIMKLAEDVVIVV